MLHASCLCGAVRWQVEGELQFASHCHCSRCRKTRGTGFATEAAVSADSFALQGSDAVSRFVSSADFTRCFCRHCGSPVPGDAWQGLVFVPFGNFEEDPIARPLAHIFVASKAPWDVIDDRLLQFDAFPPGAGLKVLGDLPPPPVSAEAPRGSCLCRGVTFVMTGAARRAHHCHCGRCRKARAAAYGSNLFTDVDGIHWLSGEELIASYKLPDAAFFTQVFCRRCGGKLPRINRERGFTVIPFGAFDDDPGIRPQSHIYVGSKAPWVEIDDELPQYQERAPSGS